MGTFKIILAIAQALACLFLIMVILLQKGKTANLSGAISGAADTFLSKGRAKAFDEKLPKWTAVVAVLFVIFTLVLNFI